MRNLDNFIFSQNYKQSQLCINSQRYINIQNYSTVSVILISITCSQLYIHNRQYIFNQNYTHGQHCINSIILTVIIICKSAVY